MSFDVGINLRSTAGAVADGANETYCVGDDYPTTRGGVTFGWEDTASGRFDYGGGLDRRLSGCNFADAGKRFRIDLPASGDYEVHLAAGENIFIGQAGVFDVKDGTTTLFGVTGNGTDIRDANDAGWSAAAWPTSETGKAVSLANSFLRVVSAGSGGNALLHVRVVAAGGTSAGSGTGSATTGGTAAGSRTATGSGTAAASASGTAAGSRVSRGAGTASASTGGLAAGTRTATGSGSGSAATGGTAAGHAPTVGGAAGSGTAAATTGGTGAGYRASAGWGSAAAATGGAGTGYTTRTGWGPATAATGGSATGTGGTAVSVNRVEFPGPITRRREFPGPVCTRKEF